MTQHSLSTAIEDFRKARRQAAMKDILSRFTGENVNLLSYEDVRKSLKASGSSERGLDDIPIDAIVGSVNRYDDFTRDFLPRGAIEPERWARVEVATTGMAGLDPIDVYKIGEAYFVKDGNHRVSVARQLGSSHIQAYVTEISTRVPLKPDIKPDDLILKAEYAGFLERTRVDAVLSEADLTLSVPGQYRLLEEHIKVHQYYMGIEWHRDVSWEEAVRHWYEAVYIPISQIIWSKGILRDFPGRTEADLYLWIAEHRTVLEQDLGLEIKPEDAAADLAYQFSSRPDRIVHRWGGKLLNTLTPDPLETGPAPGNWRREKESSPDSSSLFSDTLISLSGKEDSWSSLDQAIEISRREGGRLHGLHIHQGDDSTAGVDHIQSEFYRRIQEAGVAGRFIVSEGEISKKVCELSRWSDLVVLHLAHPPAQALVASLSSGWRKLIQRCPRPILAVPQYAPIHKLLLAYDGKPKANEALYVATYLAGKWQVPLAVLTVFESSVPPETLLKANLYLEDHGIQAEMINKTGPVAETILETAHEKEIGMLLMGGYGSNPVIDVVLGNVVDRVLRQSQTPLLICR
jgi:nucleotide-binding universal stress UspA family protein